MKGLIHFWFGMVFFTFIINILNNILLHVVDSVQAALKTELREIHKIQQGLRQHADEVGSSTANVLYFDQLLATHFIDQVEEPGKGTGHSQSPNDGILRKNCCNIPFQTKHIS